MSSQWKLVPVEPTETMVINGFESVPDECFTDEEVWEQYQEMSGCQQAAFRAKLCWAAMIASAPAPPQAELDRVTAERDALQQRLTAADSCCGQAVKALNDIAGVSRMGEKPFEIATLAIGEMSVGIEQAKPVAVVPELTSELRWILGQMCFQHIHTAQALRMMGHQIARKAEDEQAVTIYWMLGHYLKDPANWRQSASAELKASVPVAQEYIRTPGT